MTNEFMGERLQDIIEGKYILIAIISAIIIEYFMIIGDVFADFPTVVASMQLYLIITIVVVVVYHTIWSVEYTRILNIIVRSMFFILPIGVFWAFIDGYGTDTLLNFEWLFTHDMIYVILASQTVVVLIMLIGLKDYVVVRR